MRISITNNVKPSSTAVGGLIAVREMFDSVTTSSSTGRKSTQTPAAWISQGPEHDSSVLVLIVGYELVDELVYDAWK